MQQKYAQAKAAYDRKDYKTATVTFGELLSLFDDPDLAGAAQKSPLADLRMLSDGFHQLSLQALVPPPAPEPPPVVATVKPAAPVPEAPRVYSSSDTNIVPPSAVRQELPPFSGVLDRPFIAAMEVVIDENGKVISATVRGAVPASYDRQAVAAAQTWRYRPATLNGAPVKFRKFIQLSVTPR
jgi:TonB family protein